MHQERLVVILGEPRGLSSAWSCHKEEVIKRASREWSSRSLVKSGPILTTFLLTGLLATASGHKKRVWYQTPLGGSRWPQEPRFPDFPQQVVQFRPLLVQMRPSGEMFDKLVTNAHVGYLEIKVPAALGGPRGGSGPRSSVLFDQIGSSRGPSEKRGREDRTALQELS